MITNFQIELLKIKQYLLNIDILGVMLLISFVLSMLSVVWILFVHKQ